MYKPPKRCQGAEKEEGPVGTMTKFWVSEQSIGEEVECMVMLAQPRWKRVHNLTRSNRECQDGHEDVKGEEESQACSG